ncbi:MAG TPA: NAD-dependent epimerase/dehydratase family protein [Candidatus Binataceae bacterium]|nr:NAD-dependent epimerase/dehydratase family protein [Candidatus Binataceae bacterium]
MDALVIGGTGPTGPFIVNGLLDRGYRVTILHRGTHEIPEIPPAVAHIHADPHFRETLDDAIGDRSFDLVVATYGRIRVVAEALERKAKRFIAIGGVACYRGFFEPSALFPSGLATPTPEDAPLVASEEEQRFSWLIASTERSVLRSHPTAAVFRYPYVYGPYQLVPREWSIMRRILDKRPHIIVADGGLTLTTHGYAGNLAHAVLLAVDQPKASAGQIYNCGDERQLTVRQIVEVIAREMKHEWEIVNVPARVGSAARPLSLHDPLHHRVMDLFKIKTELGYRDPVPPEEGLARSVRWYLEHQPERGGEIEQRLQDPFDYAAEDELIAIYRESIVRMAAVRFKKVPPTPHPYPHPKVPGQARDHRNR